MKNKFFISVSLCALLSAGAVAAEDRSGYYVSAKDSESSGPAGMSVFDPDRWTLQFGVAMITANVIDDFPAFKIKQASGPSGGELYLFSASYNLYDFDWTIGNWQVRPQLELPMVFGIVNESGRSVFFDYNAGVTIRWKDFPFNKFVYTNIESGLGLSYTEHVMAIERERHPSRRRSHLKFYWPIQLMLAHPQRREHQFVLFIHHQSGGNVFDVGGSNMLGAGYRYVFRER